MLIRIVGDQPDSTLLLTRASEVLEDIGLLAHTQIELYDTPEYREQLNIKNFPALCIEESSIDFRDMIFEGLVPEKTELESLFISLFSTGETEKKGCSTCSTESCETCHS